ncbi:MAG: Calx-beta domain-containing protein, partial [Panacagrimonas sp.]
MALVLVSAAPAASAQTCVTPPAGLIHWQGAEDNLDDLAGFYNGNPDNTGVSFIDGQVGRGLTFDGSDDQVVVDISLAEQMEVRNNFTFEFWARPDGETADCSEGASQNCAGVVQRFAIGHQVGPDTAEGSSAGVGVAVGTNAICVSEHASFHVPCLARYEPPQPFDDWIHIAAVMENKQPRIYVNGVLVRTGVTSTKTFNFASFFRIGNVGVAGIPNAYRGDLDEISVYKRVLTDVEIQQIFDAGRGGKCKPACLANLTEGVTTDLWDTAQGSSVLSTSGLLGTSVATDLFGTTLSSVEPGHILFRNDQPDNAVHTVEWQTPRLMTAEQFKLRASHDNLVDTTRAFREFRLFGFDPLSSSFVQLYRSPIVFPYAGPSSIQPPDTRGSHLYACPNIRPLASNRFRAEFVQRGAGINSGPRVFELDGLDTANNECGPDGLLAWYRGDGDARDSIGTRHGSLQNGATFAAGQVGNAFRLDGVDDYVDIVAAPQPLTALSVDAWIRVDIDAPTAHGGAVYARRDPLSAEGFMVVVAADGRIQVTMRTNQPVSVYNSEPGVISRGVLQHLAVSYDPATGPKAYRNGVEVPLVPNGAPASGNLILSSQHVIGRRQTAATGEGAVGALYFKGLIDELHIYHRALSPTEVQEIFSTGTDGICGPQGPDIDLACLITDSPDPVATGAPLSYTVQVSNQHPDAPASGLSSTFSRPAGSSFLSAGGDGWSCTGTGPVSCTRSTPLASAASSSYTVNLTAPSAAGSITAACSVSGAQVDPNTANNSDTQNTQVQAADTTPNAFDFDDPAGVAVGSLQTSNSVTLAGFNVPLAISVSGGEYSVNSAAFTSASGTVNAGDRVRVQHTSAGGCTTTVLTVGSVSGRFTSTAPVSGTPGTLDACFDTDGYKVRAIPSGNYPSQQGDTVFTVIAQFLQVLPDGGVVVASGVTSINGAQTVAGSLFQLRADGSDDTGFSGDGLVIGNSADNVTLGFSAFERQSDGRLVAVLPLRSSGNIAVQRFNADGSLDPGFGVSGSAVVPRSQLCSSGTLLPTAMLIESDGRIVVGGTCDNGAGGGSPTFSSYFLFRLNANGSLDDGSANDSTPGDGFSVGDGSNGIFLNANADPFYNSGGEARQVVLLPQDRGAEGQHILAVIATNTVSGGARTQRGVLFIRHRPDGSRDTSFGSNGLRDIALPATNQNNSGLHAASQNDGRIVFVSSAVIGRVTAEGVLDASFGGDGLIFRNGPGSSAPFNHRELTTDLASFSDFDPRALLVQPDGRILLAGMGGSEPFVNASTQLRVARLLADGTPDLSLGDDRIEIPAINTRGYNREPVTLGLDGQGRILLAAMSGEGDTVTDRPVVARLLGATGIEPNIRPDAFSFTDQTAVPVNTTRTSNPITVAGLGTGASALIRVDGGTYSIGCTGTFTDAMEKVQNGQTVCVRHTSGVGEGVSVNTTLRVSAGADEFSDVFTSTTPGQPTVLEFSVDSQDVSEGAGTINVTITRSGGTTGAASVVISSSDGTATVTDGDYQALSTSINFAAGETSRPAQVTINDDDRDEPTENFRLRLASPSANASIGARSSMTVNILDNDDPRPGTLQFQSNAVNVAENAGSVLLTVTRTGGTDGAVSIVVATANGSATADGEGQPSQDDYQSRNETLSWLSGDATPRTVTVPILDDTRVEGDETFSASLSNPTGGALLGMPSGVTVTILDNEVAMPGTLQFSNATYAVTENGALATIDVTRVGGIDGAASVDYASSDGTAQNPADYLSATGTLEWGNGEAGVKSFTVMIVDDTSDESDEALNLTLSNPTGGAVLGTPSSATLVITDDEADRGRVRLVAANFDLAADTLFVCAVREQGSAGVLRVRGNLGAVTDVAFRSNRADPDVLIWSDGDTAPKCFDLTASTQAGAADFSLTLSGLDGTTLGTPSSAAVSRFGPGNTGRSSSSLRLGGSDLILTERFREDDGSVSLQIRRPSGTSAVQVRVRTLADSLVPGDASATAGDDFTPVDTVVAWAAGDTSSKLVNTGITADSLEEGPEWFSVIMQDPDDPATALGVPVMRLRIDPADAGRIRFNGDPFETREGRPGVIQLRREGSTAGAVSVTFTAEAHSGTSASPGEDFIATTQTVSFADGQDRVEVVVQTLVDTVDEAAETVQLRLSNPLGGASLDGDPFSPEPLIASLRILDGPVARIAPSSITQLEPEALQELSVRIDLSVATDVDVVVPLILEPTVSGETAVTRDADFQLAADSITIPAGQLSAAIPLTLLPDNAIEADETLRIGLGSAVGATIDPLARTLTLVLSNDDSHGSLQLPFATQVVDESGGVITLRVQRTGGSIGPVSVRVSTVDGTATAADGDYQASTTTLNWANDDAEEKFFQVRINEDLRDEPDEVFRVMLSQPGGGALLGPASTEVIILDNDVAARGSLQFSSATYSVAENGTLANIGVTRVGGTDGAVSVNYATANGTAVSPADYTAATGTLNWINGEGGTKSFSVMIIDDSTAESSETVNLTLSNPTGGANLGTPASAALTIIDNEPGRGAIRLLASRFETGNDLLFICAVRENGVAGQASVRLLVEGQAVRIQPATSPIMSWADGEDEPRCVDLDVQIGSGAPDFTVRLEPFGTGTVLGSPSSATVDRFNPPGGDRGPLSLRLGDSDTDTAIAASEADGALLLEVTRPRGSSAASVRVRTVANSFGSTIASATEGADYLPVDVVLNWAQGDVAPKPITIPIVDDGVADPGEAFSVLMQDPSDPQLALGIPVKRVFVVSNSAGQLRLSAPAYSTDEGEPAPIEIQRIGGTAGQVSVTLTTSAATGPSAAAAGRDFLPRAHTVTFEQDQTSAVFEVDTLTDLVSDPDSQVLLRLSDPAGGATIGSPSEAALTIRDLPVVGFQQTASSVEEPGLGFFVLHPVRVFLSVPSDRDVTIPIIIELVLAGQTAAAQSSDFVLSPSSISIPAGQTSASVLVHIFSDSSDEPDETIRLGLGTAENAVVDPASRVHRLTILDSNEPQRGTLQFSSASVNVSESRSSVTLIVTRTGGTDGSVFATVSTADGTATAADGDYTPRNVQISIGDGATSGFAQILIGSDTRFEGDETFVATLSEVIGGATLGAPAGVTINIIDDDAPVPGTLRFTDARYAVNENGTLATISVVREGGTNGPVAVNYATSDGTATSPADYTASSGTLRWADAETGSKSFTVMILDDSSNEADETVNLTLSNPTGGAMLGSPAAAILTIADNDNAGTVRFVADQF